MRQTNNSKSVRVTARQGARDAFYFFHARVTLRELTMHAVLYTHTAQRTVHYGVVIVSRNLERTNQMTDLK